MAQGTDYQRIKKFVNRTRLYANCEKSGGLHLAERGLTAGWQAGRLACRQAGWLAGWLASWPTKFGRGLKF